MGTIRSARTPFPIKTQRIIRSPLLAVSSEGEVVTLTPGTKFEICDVEDDSALLHSDSTWYRCCLDDMLDATRAK